MPNRFRRALLALVLMAVTLSACGRRSPSNLDGGPPAQSDGGPAPQGDGGPRPADFLVPRSDRRPLPPDGHRPPDILPPHDQSPLSEKVTCLFPGSSSPQSCSNSKGQTCQGLGSCTIAVYGSYGEKVDWKSTCGGYATTVLDGVSEVVYFKCQSLVTETATCTFLGSTTTQTCASSKGPSCSGITTCSLTLSGTYGETVYWKSTCGGSPTTILDGKNDSVVFTCPPPTPVKEMVTCYFKGSNTYQTCYSAKGSCQGLLGCTVIVTGTMGEQVTWKSSCGGYASTTMDGKDESAYFSCGPVVADGGVPPPIADAGGWWP